MPTLNKMPAVKRDHIETSQGCYASCSSSQATDRIFLSGGSELVQLSNIARRVKQNGTPASFACKRPGGGQGESQPEEGRWRVAVVPKIILDATLSSFASSRRILAGLINMINYIVASCTSASTIILNRVSRWLPSASGTKRKRCHVHMHAVMGF